MVGVRLKPHSGASIASIKVVDPDCSCERCEEEVGTKMLAIIGTKRTNLMWATPPKKGQGEAKATLGILVVAVLSEQTPLVEIYGHDRNLKCCKNRAMAAT